MLKKMNLCKCEYLIGLISLSTIMLVVSYLLPKSKTHYL